MENSEAAGRYAYGFAAKTKRSAAYGVATITRKSPLTVSAPLNSNSNRSILERETRAGAVMAKSKQLNIWQNEMTLSPDLFDKIMRAGKRRTLAQALRAHRLPRGGPHGNA